MWKWVRKLLKKKSPTVITPNDVNDPDELVRFIVSEAFNSGQIIHGTIDSDKTIHMRYDDGTSRVGRLDSEAQFEEVDYGNTQDGNYN
jgi:hypothetical protein